jgi:hypothetical protein
MAGPEGDRNGAHRHPDTDHSTEFYSVKFREQWRYAPDGAIIDRKVLAVAPRRPVYQFTDGDRSYGPLLALFWIKVKE